MQQEPYIRETLSTAHERALVRLVTGMGSPVNREGAALNESLATRLVVTRVRALVGVYAVVALKVGLSIEALQIQSAPIHLGRLSWL